MLDTLDEAAHDLGARVHPGQHADRRHALRRGRTHLPGLVLVIVKLRIVRLVAVISVDLTFIILFAATVDRQSRANRQPEPTVGALTGRPRGRGSRRPRRGRS